jgi:3D (Asp-Asp-Asp) domain-containing protein
MIKQFMRLSWLRNWQHIDILKRPRRLNMWTTNRIYKKLEILVNLVILVVVVETTVVPSIHKLFSKPQDTYLMVQVTSYRPIKQQCDSTPNFTSINTPAIMGICAVSQDLLHSGLVHYGDLIQVPNLGIYQVMDTMNKRHVFAIDILVYTHKQEKIVGVRPNRQVKVIYEKTRAAY